MMAEYVIEVDDRTTAALEKESERLGLEPAEIMKRALAAWLVEIAEDTPVPQDRA